MREVRSRPGENRRHAEVPRAPLLGPAAVPFPPQSRHIGQRQHSWFPVTSAVLPAPALPRLPEVRWGETVLVSGD